MFKQSGCGTAAPMILQDEHLPYVRARKVPIEQEMAGESWSCRFVS